MIQLLDTRRLLEQKPLTSFEYEYYEPVYKYWFANNTIENYNSKVVAIKVHLKSQHTFKVGVKEQYLVMGKKLDLYDSDFALLERLGIEYQRVDVPIQFKTDIIYIDIEKEPEEMIITNDRITGVFSCSVKNFQLFIY